MSSLRSEHKHCARNIEIEHAQSGCTHDLEDWRCAGESGHYCEKCVAAAWAAWAAVRGPGWS